MDELSFDFRERVAALWKCCETECGNSHFPGCLDALVPDCEWTMKSKRQWIDFVIGEENGEWSYRFTNPDRTRGAKESLSMDELKKNPNLKDVIIGRIEVTEAKFFDSSISVHPMRSQADIERLMNFVIFLSNEPHLELCPLSVHNVQIFESPEGATFLKCFSKMTFSRIWISTCFPVYNQILENQFARRKPTAMDINDFLPNREFFIEHLRNGNIKRFSGPSEFRFPAEVMERIIDRFLENPDFYDKNKFHIKAKFEESTKEMLERKLAEDRCEKVADGIYSREYRFKANNPNLEENPCMRIRYTYCRHRISLD